MVSLESQSPKGIVVNWLSGCDNPGILLSNVQVHGPLLLVESTKFVGFLIVLGLLVDQQQPVALDPAEILGVSDGFVVAVGTSDHNQAAWLVQIGVFIDAVLGGFAALSEGLAFEALGDEVGVVLVIDTLESDELCPVEGEVNIVVSVDPAQNQE